MKVTQEAIAKQLGISIATVSRALRGDKVINSEIRAEVVAMAAKLGYYPKGKKFLSMADEDMQKSHKYIGVIIKIPVDQDAWAPDEIAHGYLSGMSEISTDLNASLIVHHVSDKNVEDLLDPLKQPPMMRDGTISGIILIHFFPPHVVKYISKSVPCVSIVHDVFPANIDHIDMDNHYGVQILMDELYEQGHRKIGFVGYRQQLTWSKARLTSYIQSLLRFGLPFEPELVQNELSLNETRKKINDGVTAFVCSIDSIGYKLCRGLMDMGIKIPKEVSVVGFNGVNPLLNCPQLTTVRPPLKGMGSYALRQMMTRMQNPLYQPVRIIHRCELVKGETVGPAPSQP